MQHQMSNKKSSKDRLAKLNRRIITLKEEHKSLCNAERTVNDSDIEQAEAATFVAAESTKADLIKLKIDRLLRLKEVLEIIPVGRSTWLSWVPQGIAPAPVKIGRCTFWKQSELIEFISAQGGCHE